MFSLQTIFGKGDKFYSLLEASADAAKDAASALVAMLDSKVPSPPMDQIALARRREKDLYEQINQELVNTFVTVLEREDIDALSSALYKITKSTTKFAERYAMVASQLVDVDFASRAVLLERACEVLTQMVRQLSKGMKLDEMKALNDRLQAIEGAADKLMLEMYRELFDGRHDAIRILLLKDLFELLEKAVDRCRDAGNVTYEIVLKNS